MAFPPQLALAAVLLVVSASSSLHRATAEQHPQHVHIYVNDVTSFAQEEFPGHVEPHMSADNQVRLWYNKEREEVDVREGKTTYIWAPDYSYQYQKWYYYNQQTRVSQWEIPHELGWRRITVDLGEL